jgi:DNA-binding beta-propeller fold protein YncE
MFGRDGQAPGQFLQPEGIAADAHGNIYVGDRGNDRIQELVAPPSRTAAWQTVITIPHPMALAVDTRGDPRQNKWAYAVDDSRHVVKFGTGGKLLGSWSYGPQTRYNLGAAIAVGGSGNVFVADASTGRLVTFDPSGRLLARWGGFQIPRAVALDRAGNIYLAEQNALRVTKLSPSGQILARWHVPWANGTGSGMPVALAVDRSGNVYVGADCYQEECPLPHGIQYAVIKLSASGMMQSSLLGNNPYTPIAQGEEPFVTVSSLAVDAKGNLYVGGTLRDAKGQFALGILAYGGGTARKAEYTVPGPGDPVGMAFDGRSVLYVAQDSRVLKRA